MINISRSKRFEYWNHFVARWIVDKVGSGHEVTGPPLRRIHAEIMADDDFWQDVVGRHNGMNQTPEQMEKADRELYDHCLGNFWGMIVQTLVERIEL